MPAGSLAEVLPESFLESLSVEGLSGLREAIPLPLNAAMLADNQAETAQQIHLAGRLLPYSSNPGCAHRVKS